MSKRVQLLRHVATVANQFIGETGELTVDIDNWQLRLHDDVTPGGRLFLDRDANDERYQGRSEELDGIVGFEPNQRGYLVRLGPAEYRLREIQVNDDNLTIQNADAYDGHTLISLDPVIDSDHTVNGAWEFTDNLVGSGGFTGNLTGNVTGNLLGNVEGNVLGNLEGNADGDHTGSFTGDLNTVGHTVTMGDGQIQLEWLSQEIIDFIVNAGVPLGTIVPFEGEIEDIPLNWALCDGTLGTPDLRERFIIGVGPDYPKDSEGGSFTHTHVATVEEAGLHTHVLTNEAFALEITHMPEHWHGMADNVIRYIAIRDDPNTTLAWSNGNDPGEEEVELPSSGTQNAPLGRSGRTGGGTPHTHAGSADEAGAHSHDTTNSVESGTPPFMAKYFIMKVA